MCGIVLSANAIVAYILCQQVETVLTLIILHFISKPQNSNFPFPPMNQRRETQTETWRITALYAPAGSSGHANPPGTTSLVGQFFMAVTRNGRTDGSCSGLGGILQVSIIQICCCQRDYGSSS